MQDQVPPPFNPFLCKQMQNNISGVTLPSIMAFGKVSSLCTGTREQDISTLLLLHESLHNGSSGRFGTFVLEQDTLVETQK